MSNVESDAATPASGTGQDSDIALPSTRPRVRRPNGGNNGVNYAATSQFKPDNRAAKLGDWTGRLHSLDALRTAAALAVVLTHWPQHFFAVQQFRAPISSAPFYSVIAFPYAHGASAVTFFFCLSGFIFYWLYAIEIHAGRVSLFRFAVLRLSRLYPLHLITLILLLSLSAFTVAHTGPLRFYEYNDTYHFVLNLLFVQWWGLQSGYSWNGPTWSISVEIALYLVFYASCRWVRPSPINIFGLLIVAFSIARFSPIASAAVAFFSGGLAYGVFRVWQRRQDPKIAVCATLVALAVFALLGPLATKTNAAEWVVAVRQAFPSPVGPIAARCLEIFTGRILELVLFPTLIGATALVEATTPTRWWTSLAGAGNISYGVYLLHAPLQMFAIACAAHLGLPTDIFTRPATFVAFFATLLIAAALSYTWIEKPALLAARALLTKPEQ